MLSGHDDQAAVVAVLVATLLANEGAISPDRAAHLFQAVGDALERHGIICTATARRRFVR